MLKPYANTYQLISLLDNGAFEYSGDPVPFWSISGAGTSGSDIKGSSYSITEEPGPVYKALRFELSSSDPVTLTQSFELGSTVMDFTVPLAAGERRAIPEGYKNVERKLIPHLRPLTFSFDVYVDSGSVLIELIIPSLATGEEIVSEGRVSYDATVKKWLRVAFKFQTPSQVKEIGIRLTRTSRETSTVIKFSRFSLFNGSYDAAPYTGDVMAKAVPKGAIILWMGATCPPGYEDIGEGGLTPNDSWVQDQPDVKARKGNYPRSSEPAGNVKHTAENVDIKPGTADVELFEGFENLFIQINKKTATPKVDLSGSTGFVDIPDEYGKPNHSHELEKADTRPASIGFMFCQRL